MVSYAQLRYIVRRTARPGGRTENGDRASRVFLRVRRSKIDARVDERAQSHIRIASKYPRTTKAYLVRRGLTAEVIKLSGAIELGPLTGLCERIVDITQTGETLRQNGLVEVDTVARVSTRLVVNPARLKLDGNRIGALIDALERAAV